MKNNKEPRERLNLSIDSEILDFAKKWSFVTKRPISHLVEDMFREQKEFISGLTPESYLFNPELHHNFFPQEEHMEAFAEWLEDEAEVDYCRKNPESKRAKMRIALVKQRQEDLEKELKKQKKLEDAFIARWKEVFPSE